MEMKHTPGPWEWANDGNGNIWGRDRLDPYVISGTVEGLINVSDENARLIAAAPDLLEALIDARKQLEEYERYMSGEKYNSLMINAAIAKATGDNK